MPAISKIRFCNVSYENGGKRYNDQLFHFDGQNSAILLENGGGKTVFIQTVLQCIIPHVPMAERKIKDTLFLDQGPAHIAIEWILNEQPRRYGLTCVTLYIENNQLNSLKYTYEYSGSDEETIEELPFKTEISTGVFRPATKGEIGEYYQRMARNNPFANAFATIQDYNKHIENQFKIIPSEWKKVAVINSGEGNVDEFFNRCKTTEQLLNNLLIPVIEEAIEGENTAEFAKTFEKQREHFKKNRILHDKIEQAKGVKEEIDAYVDLYKKYDIVKSKVQKIKERAVSVYAFLEQSVSDMEKETVELEGLKERIKDDEKMLNVQKISYQVYQAEAKINDQQLALKTIEDRLQTLEIRRFETGRRRQNIQITKAEKVIKEIEDDISRLNQELALEELTLPPDDLQLKLDELKTNIKGYYSFELESIRLEIERKHQEENKLVSEQRQLKNELDLCVIKEATLKENVLKKEIHCEALELQLNTFYDQLFDAEIGCIVDVAVDEWKQEKQIAFDKSQQILLQQKEIDFELSMTEDELSKHSNVLSRDEQRLTLLQKEKSLVMDRGSALYDKLQQQGFSFNKKELIYTKEESIRALLAEKIDFVEKRQDELQAKEIDLVSRYIFKDLIHPSMLSFYEHLKQEVEFIVLGQTYLDQLMVSLDKSASELIDLYPFFTMTFVTNRKDKSIIVEYLNRHAQEMHTPIFVMTMEEINIILKREDLKREEDSIDDGTEFESMFSLLDQCYVPLQWEDSAFAASILQDLEDDREAVTEERNSINKKWILLHDLQQEINRFFTEFSYSNFLSLQEQISELEKGIQQSKTKVEELQNSIDAKVSQKNEFQKLYDDIVASIVDFETKLVIGEQYLYIQQEYRAGRLLEETFREELSDQHQIRKDIEYQLQVVTEDIKKIQFTTSEFKYEERKIKELPLYKEVESLDAFCVNVDIQVLINEKESLERRLIGLSSTREALILKIKDQSKLLSHYKEQLYRFQKEAEFPIEVVEKYYDHEEDVLFDQFVSIKKELKQFDHEKQQLEKERYAYETERKLLMSELSKANSNLFDFECDVKYIPTKLTVFEGTLRDTKRKIEKEEKEYREKRRVIEEQLTQMKIKDATYNFSAFEASQLGKQDKLQLEQHRENYLLILFRELQEGHHSLQLSKEAVQNKRQEVIEYCRSKVEDYRLKEAVTNGLSDKKELKDLLLYQERMTEIIHKTIQLANDDKRESDHELQTFLNHLLTYTKTVVGEFHALQLKTLIEFDSVQRQIFIFDIPEFIEEAAKDALRLYVDQMITLFEEEKGKDEELIRQLIEERLSVKNLLPVVLLQQPIKVKCRKVTNDLQINKAPMSWEYSNKWSGGEKWSKNMTLFLGILNYLAEKKQHLSTQHRKNRTVILDNPFGKASSKHVLDPVFYIAEKLGFQIIALTAHAEGQFISDYFPVVYSLRLRGTDQVNKLLMTSERVLNYTYLKEKAPASVARLQDATQMQLF